MYMIPVAILASMDPAVVAASGVEAAQLDALSLSGFLANVIPVTIGNIIGGGVFVAMTYYLVFVYSTAARK
jgi:formate/nitrite transporter FocA (FNT family)